MELGASSLSEIGCVCRGGVMGTIGLCVCVCVCACVRGCVYVCDFAICCV